MFEPVRTAEPAELAVSLSDAKAHLRVAHSSEDTVIGALLNAAIAHVDGYSGILGRCLVNQTWRQPFDGWPEDGVLRLPFPNVSSTGLELHYLDRLGDDETLPGAQYELLHDARGAYLRFREAFTAPDLEDDRAAPVWVIFTAGYGATSSAVPAPIKAAILLILGDLYENRENSVISDARVQALPIAADRLLTPYRRVGL